MSNKQLILDELGKLSDGATWSEITDSMLAVIANHGNQVDFARAYRPLFTADNLAECLVPPVGEPIENVLAELVARDAARKSA